MGIFGKKRIGGQLQEERFEGLLGQMGGLIETWAAALNESKGDSGGTSEAEPDLRQRIDTIELRFEALRVECLRHVQSASQRLKLVERKEEQLGVDLEEDEPQMTLPAMPLGPDPEREETDFEYGLRRMKETGVDSLAG